MKNNTMIAAPEEGNQKSTVSLSFELDLSKKQDRELLAKLKRLSDNPSSGVAMIDELSFSLSKGVL